MRIRQVSVSERDDGVEISVVALLGVGEQITNEGIVNALASFPAVVSRDTAPPGKAPEPTAEPEETPEQPTEGRRRRRRNPLEPEAAPEAPENPPETPRRRRRAESTPENTAEPPSLAATTAASSSPEEGQREENPPRRRRRGVATEAATAASVGPSDDDKITDADLSKACSDAARVLTPKGVMEVLAKFSVKNVSGLLPGDRRRFLDELSARKKAAA